MIGAGRQHVLGPRVTRHTQRLVFCLLVGVPVMAGVACQPKDVSKVTVNGTAGTVTVILKATDYKRLRYTRDFVFSSRKLVAVVHGISKEYPSLIMLDLEMYLDHNTHTDGYGNPPKEDRYAGSTTVRLAKYRKYGSPEFICQNAGFLGIFEAHRRPEKRAKRASAQQSATASPAADTSARAGRSREDEEADKVATLVAKADGRRKAGLLNDAREALKKALAIRPDNAKAARMLEEVDAAIAEERAKAKRVAEHRKWMNEGRRLKRDGRLSEAVDAFSMAIKVMPDSRDAQRALSALRGEIERKRVAATRKKEYEERMAEALQLREAGKLSQAAQAYDDAAKLTHRGPQQARLMAAACRHDHLAERAAAMAAKGDLSEAARLYEGALKEKADARTQGSLSAVRAKLEAKRRAEEERKKAAVEAARAAAYQGAMERARAFLRGKKWVDAVRTLGAVLRRKPGDPGAMKLLAAVPRHTITIDLGRNVSLELVYIGPGSFVMGRTKERRDSIDMGLNRCMGDFPPHRVRITTPFYLGKCEVTQAEYEAVERRNPSRPKGGKLPVNLVSWNDAVAFCSKVSRSSGHTVRLPTEAEWEYACRAGSTGSYCFGDDPKELGKYAACDVKQIPQGYPHPPVRAVEQRKPNAWGLHDMHGNVWEWCSDWHDAGYYARSPEADPKGPKTYVRFRCKVQRGGCFEDEPVECRSTTRGTGGLNTPRRGDSRVGFRVVLVPREER